MKSEKYNGNVDVKVKFYSSKKSKTRKVKGKK